MFSARVVADVFLDHIRYSGSEVQFLMSIRSVKFFFWRSKDLLERLTF